MNAKSSLIGQSRNTAREAVNCGRGLSNVGVGGALSPGISNYCRAAGKTRGELSLGCGELSVGSGDL